MLNVIRGFVFLNEHNAVLEYSELRDHHPEVLHKLSSYESSYQEGTIGVNGLYACSSIPSISQQFLEDNALYLAAVVTPTFSDRRFQAESEISAFTTLHEEHSSLDDADFVVGFKAAPGSYLTKFHIDEKGAGEEVEIVIKPSVTLYAQGLLSTFSNHSLEGMIIEDAEDEGEVEDWEHTNSPGQFVVPPPAPWTPQPQPMAPVAFAAPPEVTYAQQYYGNLVGKDPRTITVYEQTDLSGVFMTDDGQNFKLVNGVVYPYHMVHGVQVPTPQPAPAPVSPPPYKTAGVFKDDQGNSFILSNGQMVPVSEKQPEPFNPWPDDKPSLYKDAGPEAPAQDPMDVIRGMFPKF